MGINTKTHTNGQGAEGERLGSTQWDVVIKPLPSGLRIYGEEEVGILRARGERWLQRNSVSQTQPDSAHMNSRDCDSTHRACRWYFSTEREKCTLGAGGGGKRGADSAPQPRLAAIDTHWQRKHWLSPRVVIGVSTTLQGRPQARSSWTNKKQIQRYFCGLLFCFSLF